eukprot:277243_1
MSRAIKMIKSQLKNFQLNDSDELKNCSVSPLEDNLFKWNATIIGPPNSPYDGGLFALEIEFPESYPFNPPKIKFKTKVYHCNIDNKTGEISLHILNKGWSPSIPISKVVSSIYSLLQDPNPNNPLIPDIGKLYQVSTKEYNKIACEWSIKYANANTRNQYLNFYTFNIIHKCLLNIFGTMASLIEPVIIEMEGTLIDELPRNVEKKRQMERLQKSENDKIVIKQEKEKMERGKPKHYIHVRTITGKTLTIYCWIEDTIFDIKNNIKQIENIDIDSQTLLYAGKQLQNDKTLQTYNIGYRSTITLVLRFRGA